MQETVSSLKDKACAAFDVEQGSVVLWDYHGNRKYANLQDNMSRTLAEALVINKQAILLEAKVRCVVISVLAVVSSLEQLAWHHSNLQVLLAVCVGADPSRI